MLLSFLSDIACVMLGMHFYFKIRDVVDKRFKRNEREYWDSF